MLSERSDGRPQTQQQIRIWCCTIQACRDYSRRKQDAGLPPSFLREGGGGNLSLLILAFPNRRGSHLPAAVAGFAVTGRYLQQIKPVIFRH